MIVYVKARECDRCQDFHCISLRSPTVRAKICCDRGAGLASFGQSLSVTLFIPFFSKKNMTINNIIVWHSCFENLIFSYKSENYTFKVCGIKAFTSLHICFVKQLKLSALCYASVHLCLRSPGGFPVHPYNATIYFPNTIWYICKPQNCGATKILRTRSERNSSRYPILTLVYNGRNASGKNNRLTPIAQKSNLILNF